MNDLVQFSEKFRESIIGGASDLILNNPLVSPTSFIMGTYITICILIAVFGIFNSVSRNNGNQFLKKSVEFMFFISIVFGILGLINSRDIIDFNLKPEYDYYKRDVSTFLNQNRLLTSPYDFKPKATLDRDFFNYLASVFDEGKKYLQFQATKSPLDEGNTKVDYISTQITELTFLMDQLGYAVRVCNLDKLSTPDAYRTCYAKYIPYNEKFKCKDGDKDIDCLKSNLITLIKTDSSSWTFIADFFKMVLEFATAWQMVILKIIIWLAGVIRDVVLFAFNISIGFMISGLMLMGKILSPLLLIPSKRQQVISAYKKLFAYSTIGLVTEFVLFFGGILLSGVKIGIVQHFFPAMLDAGTGASIASPLAMHTINYIMYIAVIVALILQAYAITKIPKICELLAMGAVQQIMELGVELVKGAATTAVKAGIASTAMVATGGAAAALAGSTAMGTTAGLAGSAGGTFLKNVGSKLMGNKYLSNLGGDKVGSMIGSVGSWSQNKGDSLLAKSLQGDESSKNFVKQITQPEYLRKEKNNNENDLGNSDKGGMSSSSAGTSTISSQKKEQPKESGSFAQDKIDKSAMLQFLTGEAQSKIPIIGGALKNLTPSGVLGSVASLAKAGWDVGQGKKVEFDDINSGVTSGADIANKAIIGGVDNLKNQYESQKSNFENLGTSLLNTNLGQQTAKEAAKRVEFNNSEDVAKMQSELNKNILNLRAKTMDEELFKKHSGNLSKLNDSSFNSMTEFDRKKAMEEAYRTQSNYSVGKDTEEYKQYELALMKNKEFKKYSDEQYKLKQDLLNNYKQSATSTNANALSEAINSGLIGANDLSKTEKNAIRNKSKDIVKNKIDDIKNSGRDSSTIENQLNNFNQNNYNKDLISESSDLDNNVADLINSVGTQTDLDFGNELNIMGDENGGFTISQNGYTDQSSIALNNLSEQTKNKINRIIKNFETLTSSMDEESLRSKFSEEIGVDGISNDFDNVKNKIKFLKEKISNPSKHLEPKYSKGSKLSFGDKVCKVESISYNDNGIPTYHIKYRVSTKDGSEVYDKEILEIPNTLEFDSKWSISK